MRACAVSRKASLRDGETEPAVPAFRARGSIVMDFCFPHSRLGIAIRRGELGQQLELFPLRPQQLLEVLGEDPVQLLMQLDDLDLGLQVDLVIRAGGQAIAPPGGSGTSR